MALAKWYGIEVDTTEIQNAALPNNKVESLRANYMMGAMLGRFKKCVIGLQEVRSWATSN